MSNLSQTTVAADLGISVEALWSLSANPAFPAPTSNDGHGDVTWDSGAFATFQALWTSALARGWKISTRDLPIFNFTYGAANNPGAYYSPALVDPLWDDYP